MITETYMGQLRYVSYIQAMVVGHAAATVCLNQCASLGTC